MISLSQAYHLFVSIIIIILSFQNPLFKKTYSTVALSPLCSRMGVVFLLSQEEKSHNVMGVNNRLNGWSSKMHIEKQKGLLEP